MDRTNKVVGTGAANNAILVDKAIVANVVNEAVVTKKLFVVVDEAIVSNKIDKASVPNQAIEASLYGSAHGTNEAIELNELDEANKIVQASKAFKAVKLPLLLPFSLTQYFTIFAKMKGYLGTYNNQLGSLKRGCLNLCSLIIQFVCSVIERVFINFWSKWCSLRSQCINQLERKESFQMVAGATCCAPSETRIKSTINLISAL